MILLFVTCIVSQPHGHLDPVVCKTREIVAMTRGAGIILAAIKPAKMVGGRAH